MRSTLLLLVLTYAPAFCQDNAAPKLNVPKLNVPKLNDNLRQRLGQLLNPPGAKSVLTPLPTLTQVPPALISKFTANRNSLCSISLLNATAPNKPVPMPQLKIPQNTAHPLDRMAAAPPPAPACPADFSALAKPAAPAKLPTAP